MRAGERCRFAVQDLSPLHRLPLGIKKKKIEVHSEQRGEGGGGGGGGEKASVDLLPLPSPSMINLPCSHCGFVMRYSSSTNGCWGGALHDKMKMAAGETSLWHKEDSAEERSNYVYIGGFSNLNYCWWIFTLLGMLRQTTIDIMNIIFYRKNLSYLLQLYRNNVC